MNPEWALVLGVFLLGVVPLGFGLRQLFLELSARGWPQIPGTIVISRIEKQAVKHGYQFVPIIEFEFSYDGQVFRSSSRNHGNYISGQSVDAEAIAVRYPVGAAVMVLLNERTPGKSVLEAKVTPASLIVIFIGLLFTVMGVLTILMK